jgi:hypothetical protein
MRLRQLRALKNTDLLVTREDTTQNWNVDPLITQQLHAYVKACQEEAGTVSIPDQVHEAMMTLAKAGLTNLADLLPCKTKET